MTTIQENFWTSKFGAEYTERNSPTLEDWNKNCIKTWGISKLEMNEKMLKPVSKDAKILEVGCNVGMQLKGLQTMGFDKLYGVEIQKYAVERAKDFTKNINIIQGSAFDIPYKDDFFEVVFTNGVLIHISPTDLPKVMDEMYRCSSKYIWGWEYYAEDITKINYRGNDGFLWKGDYAQLFLDRFSDLKLVAYQDYPYLTDAELGNTDRMYLLSK